MTVDIGPSWTPAKKLLQIQMYDVICYSEKAVHTSAE